MKELFAISRGNISNQKELVSDPKGIAFIAQHDDNNGFIDRVKPQSHKKFAGNSLVVGRQTAVVYFQEHDFITTDGVLVLTPQWDFIRNRYIGMALASSLTKQLSSFGYSNTVSETKLNMVAIQLPIKNGTIDFEYMERVMADLEAQHLTLLREFLFDNGLTEYQLTEKEIQALEHYHELKWGNFNLEKLFGKSTRGKRLKSEDRIPGMLPFVTAGEKNEGVSDFVGNNVAVFAENTTTIDMFGSAKYRSFKYGGDDHIAVVHTDSLSKLASVFVSSAIHKASSSGQFHYGRNFYAKDADALDIALPMKDNKPDYETMETIISAIQKLVIKEVVLYVDAKTKSQ